MSRTFVTSHSAGPSQADFAALQASVRDLQTKAADLPNRIGAAVSEILRPAMAEIALQEKEAGLSTVNQAPAKRVAIGVGKGLQRHGELLDMPSGEVFTNTFKLPKAADGWARGSKG